MCIVCFEYIYEPACWSDFVHIYKLVAHGLLLESDFMKHLWEFVAHIYIYDDAYCCVVVFVVFCEGHTRFLLDRGRMIVVILADVYGPYT